MKGVCVRSCVHTFSIHLVYKGTKNQYVDLRTLSNAEFPDEMMPEFAANLLTELFAQFIFCLQQHLLETWT